MNFQIFTNNALEDAWNTLNREINNNQIFETMFIPPIKYMLEKKKFKHFDLTNKSDFSKLRFTLDHSEDFKFIKKIYESLYHKNKYFDLNDILLLLEKNPNLLNINKNRLNQDKNVLLIEK